MSARLCLPVVAVGLTLLTVPVSAATIHVPGEEPTIQAGIDAASYGDTVVVACGTYYEHDIEMRSGVHVTSETGVADCVTIDAQQQGRVFHCDGVDSLASLVGLTITHGLTPGGSPYRGGGMYCRDSSPRLTNCTFAENHAPVNGFGGGLYCVGGSLRFENVIFIGNSAHSGGGIRANSSSLWLADCALVDNTGGDSGGGIFYMNSSVRLTRSTVSGNAAIFGGGVYDFQSTAVLTDCTLSDNTAQAGGGMISDFYTYPSLTNVTFSHNSASLLGGGLYSLHSSIPVFANCLIAFSTQGEAVSGPATPACCDFYGNAGGDWVGDVAGWYGINGNFSADPLFCLGDNPDQPYTLHDGSPCLPENSPCGELVGAFGQGCEVITAVEAVRWGAIKAMYR